MARWGVFFICKYSCVSYDCKGCGFQLFVVLGRVWMFTMLAWSGIMFASWSRYDGVVITTAYLLSEE